MDETVLGALPPLPRGGLGGAGGSCGGSSPLAADVAVEVKAAAAAGAAAVAASAAAKEGGTPFPDVFSVFAKPDRHVPCPAY